MELCSDAPTRYADFDGQIGKPAYEDGFDEPKKARPGENAQTGWMDR